MLSQLHFFTVEYFRLCYFLQNSEVKKLTKLEELNVSGNQLTSLPPSLGCLTKLAVVRVHSNRLHSLPSFRDAASLHVSVFCMLWYSCWTYNIFCHRPLQSADRCRDVHSICSVQLAARSHSRSAASPVSSWVVPRWCKVDQMVSSASHLEVHHADAESRAVGPGVSEVNW